MNEQQAHLLSVVVSLIHTYNHDSQSQTLTVPLLVWLQTYIPVRIFVV